MIIGEKLQEYHRRLSSLDNTSFLSENLKHVPKSKHGMKQCSYEYRKSKLVHDSVTSSLKILEARYKEELPNSFQSFL